jgi:spore coat protein SA
VFISSEVAPYSPVEAGAVVIQHEKLTQLTDWSIEVIAPKGVSAEFSDFTIHRISVKKLFTVETAFKFVSQVSQRLTGYKTFTASQVYGFVAAVRASRLRPDVVLVYNRFQTAMWATRMARRSSIVLFMDNEHLSNISDARLHRVFKNVDVIAVPSNFLGNTITQRRCGPSEMVVTLRHGISSDVFFPGNRSYCLEEQPQILYVGRLVPEKGVHLLIQAFKLLLNEYPNAELTIAGGAWFGSESRSSYIASLESLTVGIETQISFLGSVSHRDLPELYRNANLFVMPSIWREVHGQVNLEAMATALPIITTRRGGIPECVGDTAVLLDEVDVESLLSAMQKIVNCPQIARSMGERARNRAIARFGWRVLMPEYRSFLEALRSSKTLD